MEWTEALAITLIKEVQNEPAIWDPENPDKKSKTKNFDAWKRILDKKLFNTTNHKELSDKWKHLTQSYRGYRRRIQESKRSGAGAGEVYKPSWFAYDALDVFMHGTYHPTNTRDVGDELEDVNENDDELSDFHRDRLAEESTDDPGTGHNQPDASPTTEGVINTENAVNESAGNEVGDTQQSATPSATSKSPGKVKTFKSPRKIRTVYQRLKQQHSSSSKSKQPSQQEAMSIACNYLKMKSEQAAKNPEKVSKASTPENDTNGMDVCGLFGLLTAEKLRNLDPNKQPVVMHEIDGVLLKYMVRSSSSTPASTYSPSSQSTSAHFGASPFSYSSGSPMQFYPLSPSTSPSTTPWHNILSSPSHSNSSTPTYVSEGGSDPFLHFPPSE